MNRCKFYKLKHYLTCYEAIEYLEYLAGGKITGHDLLSLVRSDAHGVSLRAHILIDDLQPEYVSLLNNISPSDDKLKLWKYALVIDGFSAIQINNETWGGLISAFPGDYRTIKALALFPDFTDGSPIGEAYEFEIHKTQPVHQSDSRPLGRNSYGLNLYFLSDDIQSLAKLVSNTEESKKDEEFPQPKHAYKGIQQEELILNTLKELGYNPESLPKATSAGGAKAQVKKQLDRSPPFEAKTSFDNAWKVLLSREEIKNS